MFKAHTSLIFLLLSVSLIFASAEDPAISPFVIGDEHQIELAGASIVYYKFTVPYISPNFDLSIIADPAGDCDPELFLSTKEQYPKSRDTSEYYSTSYGYSSIYVPSAEVKPLTDYYLGVFCASEQCDFNLTVTYAQEYYMRPQTSRAIIEYTHEGTLVARVYIPKSDKAGHILFAAELQNIDEVDEGLHMYANAGNDIPTSQTHDVAATTAWKDGKAAFIYNGDKFFCTGCNYTLTIEAPKKSKIILTRTVYGDVLATPLNFERNDAVQRNHSVHYLVNTTRLNANSSFILVEVKPYIGFFKVYANYGTLPDKLTDYQFSMIGHSQEMLWIPVNEKSRHEPLYITVNGFSHTTYTLRVYEEGKKNLVLELGEPETSYVPSNTVENFLSIIDGRKDMKLTFSLHPEKGHVDLFVKSCPDKKCSFTLTEVNHILSGATPTSKKSPIIQFSNVTDGDEVINIEMDGSVCSPASGSNVPKCYFAVGVLGTSKTASKFTLTATKAGLHQPLRVGRPVREHLSLDQYKYYYFTVPNDTGIDSVNFQVTKISGDVGIFISRTSKYPDLKTRENTHHYNDLYSFERQNFSRLNGTFYVAVKAYTSATYSVLPIVKYDTEANDMGTHHLVKIAEGIPQKTVLDNHETMYFKFDSNFVQDESSGLEISLNEVQGNFEICVRNDDQFPTPHFCQFSTTDSTLIIPSTTEGYRDVATYIVAIFPKVSNHSNSTSNARAQSFSITWSAFHNFRTLSFSVPFSNWVSHSRSLYYKFEAHPVEDKEIIIHKTTTSSSNAKVELFLATSNDKFAQNATSFEYDKASDGSDTIRLKEADIISLCSKSTQSGVLTDSKKCYLYVAVTTTSEDDVHFILSLTKDFDDLRLSESIQTYYSFPTKSHPLHLYYYPHHLEDITLLAHTWGRHITLYANVVNTREHSSRREWNYPTNRSHEYVSRESSSHKGESRLHISAADLSSCGSDYDKFRCGVALTLYYDVPAQENNSTSHYKEYSMFSIMANQEITPIGAGRPIHTSVNEGSYKYFSLHVNKDQATLLISASVLSGKHIVILATKGKDARPTMDTYEFISPYGKMETLQVSGEETIQGTAKGDWVIAVYGFSHTEFVLNVVYEKTKIIELHRGLPTTIDVSVDPVFFEYYHEIDSSFQIKLTRERGAGVVSMKKYTEDKMLAGNLPNQTNGDITRHFDQVQTMITVSNSTEYFTKDCLYVIGVFAHKSMKISIVAQIPGQFIFLQDNMIFTDYASKTIHNKYEHVAWSNRMVDINMVVYSGEPHVYISHNPTVNESKHLWSYDEPTPNNFIRLKLNNTKFNGQHLEPVFDGHNFIQSMSNIYYIMVTAPVPSNYSIAVSVSNSTRYLIDGHMDFGFLNTGEFNLYKYHVSQDSATQSSTYKLKLQFAMYKDEFSLAKHEKFQAPHITVMTIPQNQKNVNIINQQTLVPDVPVLEPVRSDVLERGHGDQSYLLNLQYLAPADHDFYIVVNNTQSLNHLNYSITANTHEPLYLTMNNMHASRVPVGESDIYAVHAGHAGLLVIEIHECMGKVVVESSHSRHFVSTVHNAKTASLYNYKPNVDDESFTGQSSVEPDVIPTLNTLTTSSLGSHISLASIELQEEQTVYIIVTGLDGQVDSDAMQDKDAVYKIRTNLHPLRNFLPFTNLEPGNDGNLEWDITSGGKLKLGFDEVHNLAYMSDKVKSSKFGDLDIHYKYDVFFTKSAQASLYLTRCDMLPKSEGVFKGMDRYSERLSFDQSNITTDSANNAHKSVEIDLGGELTDVYATLKITAVGVDYRGQPVWDYPIIYKTAEVKNITPGGVYSFLTFLLGLCLIMLIVALVGLYYYYDKFKRVKARLNYEMQDIRNIASTVESFDVLDDTFGEKKQKGGYHGLIEEENV